MRSDKLWRFQLVNTVVQGKYQAQGKWERVVDVYIVEGGTVEGMVAEGQVVGDSACQHRSRG